MTKATNERQLKTALAAAIEASGDAPALLEVDRLQTFFDTPQGIFKAVDGVSFSVRAVETLAIGGELGCGKSVTALSLMRLVPDPPGPSSGGTRPPSRAPDSPSVQT